MEWSEVFCLVHMAMKGYFTLLQVFALFQSSHTYTLQHILIPTPASLQSFFVEKWIMDGKLAGGKMWCCLYINSHQQGKALAGEKWPYSVYYIYICKAWIVRPSSTTKKASHHNVKGNSESQHIIRCFLTTHQVKVKGETDRSSLSVVL